MVSMFKQECPVVFGVDAINNIAQYVKDFNGTSVLCICDEGVRRSGIADRIIELLSKENISAIIYDEVKPDPKESDVDRAGEIALSNSVDVVLGVGGGSVLDTAKMVAVLLENSGRISDYFVSKGVTVSKKAPSILIPTSSGTGSEVTRMAVVTSEKNHSKASVVAGGSLALVDPVLTITVPPHVTAATGLDALAQAIESYTSKKHNPRSDVLALTAVSLISKNLLRVFDHGTDLEARVNMSIASNFAGISFNDTGVHFGHAVAHEFGTVFGMAHGVACAITLPEVIAFSAKEDPLRCQKIAEALGIDMETTPSESIGQLAADAVRNMMRYCGIKSLKMQGIKREEASGCAANAIATNPFYHNTIRPVSVEELEMLIHNMYDNYQ